MGNLGHDDAFRVTVTRKDQIDKEFKFPTDEVHWQFDSGVFESPKLNIPIQCLRSPRLRKFVNSANSTLVTLKTKA